MIREVASAARSIRRVYRQVNAWRTGNQSGLAETAPLGLSLQVTAEEQRRGTRGNTEFRSQKKRTPKPESRIPRKAVDGEQWTVKSEQPQARRRAGVRSQESEETNHSSLGAPTAGACAGRADRRGFSYRPAGKHSPQPGSPFAHRTLQQNDLSRISMMPASPLHFAPSRHDANIGGAGEMGKRS